jgi:hypothetical protein
MKTTSSSKLGVGGGVQSLSLALGGVLGKTLDSDEVVADNDLGDSVMVVSKSLVVEEMDRYQRSVARKRNSNGS